MNLAGGGISPDFSMRQHAGTVGVMSDSIDVTDVSWKELTSREKGTVTSSTWFLMGIIYKSDEKCQAHAV